MPGFREGGRPPQEQKTVEDSKREALGRVRAEREKIEQFGRIGQRVKIRGRSISPDGEVVGEIVAIETRHPYSEEYLSQWEQEGENLQDLPLAIVKVYVTEGKYKGETVTHLVPSEWEPAD